MDRKLLRMQCNFLTSWHRNCSMVLLEAKNKQEVHIIRAELCTRDISPEMVTGEGGHSKVCRSILRDGQPAAVKVHKSIWWSAEDLLREMKLLNDVNHDNIIQNLGYCCYRGMHAVVYDLLKGSLKQKLRQLKVERKYGFAVGVVKALDSLYSQRCEVI